MNLKEFVQDSYMLMELMIDKDNYYPYQLLHNAKSIWAFRTKNNYKYGIRSLFEPVNKYIDGGHYEIKFGIILDNGKWSYDRPMVNDEKVFNTILKIAFDEIISKFDFIDAYRIPSVDNDPARHRLYKIAITKYLPSDWELYTEPKDSDTTIWIRRKK